MKNPSWCNIGDGMCGAQEMKKEEFCNGKMYPLITTICEHYNPKMNGNTVEIQRKITYEIDGDETPE